MPNKNLTVCFSGHRTFSRGDDGGRLAEAVEAARADGYRTFVSGMAAGFDLAAAEAVLRLRASGADVRLVCAVPFAGHINDESVVALADEVHILAPEYAHGVFYRRNEWMVERSGRLICWYDAGTGSSSRGSGASSGTRHTVRAALASGLEIVNLFRPSQSLF